MERVGFATGRSEEEDTERPPSGKKEHDGARDNLEMTRREKGAWIKRGRKPEKERWKEQREKEKERDGD